jgi:lon-related putative ATP-dependent protease
MNKKAYELSVSQLRQQCDPSCFNFNSTADLQILDAVVGQERAVRAISFGIDIESPGYHMYALGPAGTGKSTTIQKFLKRKSADQPTPDDWLYVNNFEDQDRPRAISLPAGMGRKFKEDMDRLVSDLETEIPSAFESEDYENEQEKIQQKFRERRKERFKILEQKARKRDFRLLQTPRGIILAPVLDGNVITNEQFSELDPHKREELEARQDQLQEEMREILREIQNLQQEAKDEIRKLDEQVVGYTVEHLIDILKEKYDKHAGVVDFLESVREDILKNVETFKKSQQMQEVQQQIPILGGHQQAKPTFNQYRVNLTVDNSKTEGAPLVLESNPTHANLLGRIDHLARLGALVTNFQMIKSGALHRANGGYLMVDATEILTSPSAWEGLKRALKDREIKIESLHQSLGAISTRTLEPEPIPLDIKVIVTGNPMIYYLLYNLDEDFRELFKVKADFGLQMDWTDEAVQQYAQFIASIATEEHLSHFTASGVAKIVEHSARIAGNQQKLATKFGDIVDLIREASYWASQNNHDLVQDQDVKKAIDEQIYRANRLEESIQEMIENGIVLIDTEGEVPGQVNGISVLPLGDYEFGKPSRITARTHVGKAGVVNIDREIELGGRIHNKGVMILAGYLGGKFAQEYPLAFSASITFEQLYEEVEGDSASSAELYALLSSLSGYPIQQNLAVTGSVNQRGQIQAIGGVNQKIEGFYDICKIKGLNGQQGVLIPSSNVKHLMLREDILETVQEGKFHIYAVATISEGIELLTGVAAGERQEDGSYPEGTVFHAVQSRLLDLARRVQAFNKSEETTKNR